MKGRPVNISQHGWHPLNFQVIEEGFPLAYLLFNPEVTFGIYAIRWNCFRKDLRPSHGVN